MKEPSSRKSSYCISFLRNLLGRLPFNQNPFSLLPFCLCFRSHSSQKNKDITTLCALSPPFLTQSSFPHSLLSQNNLPSLPSVFVKAFTLLRKPPLPHFKNTLGSEKENSAAENKKLEREIIPKHYPVNLHTAAGRKIPEIPLRVPLFLHPKPPRVPSFSSEKLSRSKIPIRAEPLKNPYCCLKLHRRAPKNQLKTLTEKIFQPIITLWKDF